jgi:hypothetical protein
MAADAIKLNINLAKTEEAWYTRNTIRQKIT